MKDISPILRSLDFVDSEIKTYMSALEHGPSTVIDITKVTHLSRQATYVAIESLTKRGLMASLMKGKKRYYTSEDPEKLLSYAERKHSELKERIHDLNSALPELKLKVGGEKPVVKLFEGKEGITSILADIGADSNKDIYELVDLPALQAIFTSDDLKPFQEVFISKKHQLHALHTGTPRTGRVAASPSQLPEKYNGFNSEVFLYGNKVALITYVGKMHSVVIDSEPIVSALKVLFELAIERSKELSKGSGDKK